jgi:hypothetical protein
MDKERWGATLDRILSEFEVVEHTKTAGSDNIGEVETIIFVSPIGKVKLEYISRPAILDKKIIGAHRRGKSAAQVEYVYSETETTGKLNAWRYEGGDWQVIDAQAFE